MKIKSVLFVAAVCVLAALTSCGGSKKGGLPDFSDDDFAVATIGTSSAALQTTYPATIKGIQDVEVRPKAVSYTHLIETAAWVLGEHNLVHLVADSLSTDNLQALGITGERIIGLLLSLIHI